MSRKREEERARQCMRWRRMYRTRKERARESSRRRGT